MQNNIWIYMLVMAVITYLVRMVPYRFSNKEIKNTFIKSFLYYVPYACLAAMIFPAILSSTAFMISAIVGFIVAIVLAYLERSMFIVAGAACLAVMLTEMVIKYLL